MQRERDSLADILKGIGIISVVIGHSGVLFPGLEKLPTVQFVYLYHLMVFFFVSGMIFNPKKYDDIYLYIGKQIKSSYPLYVIYNIIFLALHNVMVDIQMLELNRYNVFDFIIQGSHTLTMHYTEAIVGSLWFVPMFLIAKSLFAVSFKSAEKCKFKLIGHIIVVFIYGILGVFTNHYDMFLVNNMQTALIGIPVIYMGYIFNQYKDKAIKYATPISCVVSVVLMFFLLYSDIGSIELSANQIISPILFYPVTMLGILFCVSFAQIVQKSSIFTKVFSHLGSISFHIMALHFVVFKCFDWIYGLASGVDRTNMMRFPTALDNIGLIYCTLGIGVPVLLVGIVRKLPYTYKKG